ncbi:methyltransferase domain-containing protein [Candidatus Woesearchaeota archaeon]|nr:methyltransferase domain-containing protein [Candidatus Woesearchaeota archaeon]
MKEIKKVLVCGNRKFFVRELDKDFHTQYGFVKSKDLVEAKNGDKLVSNTGRDFFIFAPSFIDSYSKIKRGAQIIPLKDIGLIIAETGVNKDSIVLDAGSGSGALCCFLANLCKKVYSYEIRDDFFNIVKRNIDFLGLENIELKKKDIYSGIDEKELDLIVLDLPEPWKVIGHASKSLKVGGFLVNYSPTIPQTADFVNALTDSFVHVKTVEVIEREWEIKQRKVRPLSRGIGHSGFVSVVRRVR